MCGFAAFVGHEGVVARPGVIECMARVIAHRGPDDYGTYFSDSIGFGFRRLAILDLTPAGHQPMSSQDGKYTIIFNGEIYNYVEIRKELTATGHIFISGSDTEVLLHAYMEWGENCLDRLNGMWAFLIHDRHRQSIFGSRDRFGMKPLYLHKGASYVLLASEIKSIRASGLYQESLNLGTCARFFYEDRLDDTNKTFFGGIDCVPAGHAFTINAKGKVSMRRYWHTPREERHVTDPASTFAKLFEQSVQVHLRSDVPIGVNLSGGLDSTSIICSIARERERLGTTQPLRAFSFEAHSYDESAYIDATVRQTGALREALSLSPVELWNSLRTVLWYQDEPMHSMTGVISFHLSALAARHGVKVVLNGQGADETLGGYPSYFRDYWYTLLIRRHPLRALAEIRAYTDVHAPHGSTTASIFSNLLRHSLQTQFRRSAWYRRLSHRKRLSGYARDDWFNPSLVKELPDEDEFVNPTLNTRLEHAVGQDPLPLYLRVEDRNAMAHSVEARLPFLDPRLVEFAFSLPPDWKLHGPWNKRILREAMAGLIPENVRIRPDKMGFPTPFSDWLRNELYPAARAVLDEPGFNSDGLFKVDAIRRDLDRHRQGDINIAHRFFKVAEFAIWRGLSPSQAPA